MRVKIFTGTEQAALETEVNNWLCGVAERVVSTHVTSASFVSVTGQPDINWTVFIFYRT